MALAKRETNVEQREVVVGTTRGSRGRPVVSIILLALTFVSMMIAIGMIFLYVPTDAIEGIPQRIFYFHVPVAWIGGAASSCRSLLNAPPLIQAALIDLPSIRALVVFSPVWSFWIERPSLSTRTPRAASWSSSAVASPNFFCAMNTRARSAASRSAISVGGDSLSSASRSRSVRSGSPRDAGRCTPSPRRAGSRRPGNRSGSCTGSETGESRGRSRAAIVLSRRGALARRSRPQSSRCPRPGRRRAGRTGSSGRSDAGRRGPAARRPRRGIRLWSLRIRAGAAGRPGTPAARTAGWPDDRPRVSRLG